jgi:hypothetical protein
VNVRAGHGNGEWGLGRDILGLTRYDMREIALYGQQNYVELLRRYKEIGGGRYIGHLCILHA